jgi:hypothetical protein
MLAAKFGAIFPHLDERPRGRGGHYDPISDQDSVFIICKL